LAGRAGVRDDISPPLVPDFVTIISKIEGGIERRSVRQHETVHAGTGEACLIRLIRRHLCDRELRVSIRTEFLDKGIENSRGSIEVCRRSAPWMKKVNPHRNNTVMPQDRVPGRSEREASRNVVDEFEFALRLICGSAPTGT